MRIESLAVTNIHIVGDVVRTYLIRSLIDRNSIRVPNNWSRIGPFSHNVVKRHVTPSELVTSVKSTRRSNNPLVTPTNMPTRSSEKIKSKASDVKEGNTMGDGEADEQQDHYTVGDKGEEQQNDEEEEGQQPQNQLGESKKRKAPDGDDDDDDDDDDEGNDDEDDDKKLSPSEKKSTRIPLWSDADDDELLRAVVADRKKRGVGTNEEQNDEEEDDWDEIAKSVPGKTPVQCLRRFMKLDGGEQRGIAMDDADDSESASPSSSDRAKAKKPRKDSDQVSWSQEEVDLLRKLVEAYSDCKSAL